MPDADFDDRLDERPPRGAGPYADRTDAGRRLAAALKRHAFERPIVYALPRGGVPVGLEVARALDAPLDLVFVRKLGAPVPRGPRQSTAANAAGMTEREAEIAELLAAGHSNHEIAERLVLSEKTVGHHVSAILGKLGVRRRAEVAARLAAEGAAPR